jgi:UPF0176 protein
MYVVLAYYYFCSIEDPAALVEKHKAFFKKRDFKGRIYISKEGINGQASAPMAIAKEYMEWICQDPRFEKMTFKLNEGREHVFEKMTVKVKKRLVAFTKPIDLEKRGHHLSPQEWNKVLNSDQDYILIDVRNDYEYKIGHFVKAYNPNCNTTHQFAEFLKELKSKTDLNKKILMYCTGGIRCEYFSSHMVQEGFKDVNQLDGGVINYGNVVGGDGWLGKLFVFDDRMAVDISKIKSSPLAQCLYCKKPEDCYYNCANMDCNALFIACTQCYIEHKGCCASTCQDLPRTRSIESASNKPFRKWYFYFKRQQKSQALDSQCSTHL